MASASYGMDLDVTVHVLRFNRHEQRPEPLKGTKVAADPEKIHFPKPSLLLGIVYAIPDAFKNRRERGNSNACSDKDSNFIFEDIFRRASEWPINENAWQDSSKRGIHIYVRGFLVDPNHGRNPRLLSLGALLEITSHRSC